MRDFLYITKSLFTKTINVSVIKMVIESFQVYIQIYIEINKYINSLKTNKY